MIDHEDRQVVTVPRWAMLECDGDARDAMVLAQVTWWMQPGQRDGTPRTRQLVERDGHTWMHTTDAELAEELGMSRAQVQRGRSALVKRGLLASMAAKVEGSKVTLVRPVAAGLHEVEQSTPEPAPDRAPSCNGSSREVAESRARATPPVEPREETDPSAPDGAGHLPGMGKPAATAADQLRDRARECTRLVFEQKVPKPAHTFVAVLGIAKALLVAGHTDEAVVRAMVGAPTITTAAVEFQLARGGAGAGPANRGNMDTDRGAATGSVKL